MLDRVISGGQTGVDQAAWRAAKALGIPTGGSMTRAFQTEDGPRPEFAEMFGAVELGSVNYPARTRANVRDSDGTIWFGDVREVTGLSKPFREGRFLGHRNLGQPAYLRPKGTGDHSMPVKRELPRVSHGGVPRGPRGMAKTRLSEAQSRPDHNQSRRYADSVRRRRMPLPRKGASESPSGASPSDGVSGDRPRA